MASSLVLRRTTTASPLFLNKLLNVSSIRSCSVAPPVIRSFSTDTQVTNYDSGDRSVDGDRRSDRSVSRRRRDFGPPSLFSEGFIDPFNPMRSLSQMMNLMDQLVENPFSNSMSTRGMGRRGWDVKEDEEALYLRMEMPGVDKEQVKVYVEENTLVIKGEGEKEESEEEDGAEYGKRRYMSRIDLTPSLYKTDGIKAEMKNGVLKVIVPKVKQEERKNVFDVQID